VRAAGAGSSRIGIREMWGEKKSAREGFPQGAILR